MADVLQNTEIPQQQQQHQVAQHHLEQLATPLAKINPKSQQFNPNPLISERLARSLPVKVNRTSVPLLSLLEGTTLNQLLGSRQREIIVVFKDTKVQECLSTLAKHNILSMPVQCKDSRDLKGFVDVMDLLTFIVRTCSLGPNIEDWSNWSKGLENMSHKGQSIASLPIKELIDASQVDPFFPVYGNGTIAQLIEHFSKGIHRAAVYNKVKTIVHNIVSQSDVVRFIMNSVMKDTSLLGVLSGKTVEQLDLISRPVITMSIDDQAIYALYLIEKHRVNAIAITDDSGQIVANFSASEVRGLSHENWDSLLQPVIQFLTESKAVMGERHEPRISAPVTCTASTSVETVILKLGTYRIHRVWIVDENNKPIGLISLTDIMRLFCPVEAEGASEK